MSVFVLSVLVSCPSLLQASMLCPPLSCTVCARFVPLYPIRQFCKAVAAPGHKPMPMFGEQNLHTATTFAWVADVKPYSLRTEDVVKAELVSHFRYRNHSRKDLQPQVWLQCVSRDVNRRPTPRHLEIAAPPPSPKPQRSTPLLLEFHSTITGNHLQEKKNRGNLFLSTN